MNQNTEREENFKAQMRFATMALQTLNQPNYRTQMEITALKEGLIDNTGNLTQRGMELTQGNWRI